MLSTFIIEGNGKFSLKVEKIKMQGVVLFFFLSQLMDSLGFLLEGSRIPGLEP